MNSLFNPLVMFNTKLRGRSILSVLHRTHKYASHRRQKQLSPIVPVSNEITNKAVPSDNAEFRTWKTRPQTVPITETVASQDLPECKIRKIF